MTPCLAMSRQWEFQVPLDSALLANCLDRLPWHLECNQENWEGFGWFCYFRLAPVVIFARTHSEVFWRYSLGKINKHTHSILPKVKASHNVLTLMVTPESQKDRHKVHFHFTSFYDKEVSKNRWSVGLSLTRSIGRSSWPSKIKLSLASWGRGLEVSLRNSSLALADAEAAWLLEFQLCRTVDISVAHSAESDFDTSTSCSLCYEKLPSCCISWNDPET